MDLTATWRDASDPQRETVRGEGFGAGFGWAGEGEPVVDIVDAEVDTSGRLWIVAVLEGAMSVGPCDLTSRGAQDNVVPRLDGDGSWSAMSQVGGEGEGVATDLAVDVDDGAVVVRMHHGQGDFGASRLKAESTFGIDHFAAKVGTTEVWAWALGVERSGYASSALAFCGG